LDRERCLTFQTLRHYLEPRSACRTITKVAVPIPWLVRTSADEFQTLVGHRFVEILRHRKYLQLKLDDELVLT
jgi:formamidopyrimidine-DNA glycosylase